MQTPRVLTCVCVCARCVHMCLPCGRVFNHAQHYKHESINLQNMRLYASGTVLNAIYCRMTAGPGVLSGMGDMRPGHYVIVLGLACMGLVTVSHSVTTCAGTEQTRVCGFPVCLQSL